MDTRSDTKRGFVAGFLDSSTKSHAQNLRLWDIESEIVATTGHMLDFLSANRGAWTVESAKFVFSDDRSLVTFNAYVTKINGLVRSEQAIRNAALQQIDKKMQSVEQR
jgi:hypothetical protein